MQVDVPEHDDSSSIVAGGQHRETRQLTDRNQYPRTPFLVLPKATRRRGHCCTPDVSKSHCFNPHLESFSTHDWSPTHPVSRQRAACASIPHPECPDRQSDDKTDTHHVRPCSHDRLHVQIRREESHDAIGNRLDHVCQDCAKVSHDGWVVSDFESRTDTNLVASSGDDLFVSHQKALTHHWQKGIASQSHWI